MADAALNIAAEQVIEFSAYGALLQRDGNRGPAAAPQNIYRCADIDEFGRPDSWVAVAVATDAHWTALRDALGAPEWTAAEALTTHAGRVAQHDLIDERLADWCATRSADDIVETLWPAGVPVAKVMQPHRQTELPQLQYRRFFEYVGHPVNPAAPHSTLPIALSRGPAEFHRAAAPMLGEHNHELLAQLGLTPEDIAVLEDLGVIGTEPGSRKVAR